MYNDYLEHYGVKGMKWGVRKDPQIKAKNKRSKREILFVSGTSKSQDKTSGFYRANLSKSVRRELNNSIKNNEKIIVGDAPGIDSQVQDYLNTRYKNVEVYTSNREPRYLANKNWKVKRVNASKYPEGSKEFLAAKDKAMTRRATKGLAVTITGGAKATRANVQRLIDQNKSVKVYNITRSRLA